MSRSDAKELEAFLAALAAKDRTNVERHLATADAEPTPTHGKVWRQVAMALRRLAPHAAQTIGQHVVQYFIADGKYRMQVFALEDQNDGNLLVYVPDVLADAIEEGIIAKQYTGGGEDGLSRRYPIPGKKNEALQVDALDAANTPEPPNHFKNMLGWNRKALRVRIPTAAANAQAQALKTLCAVAARQWANAKAQS